MDKSIVRRQRDANGNLTEPRKLDSPLVPLTKEEQITMLQALNKSLMLTVTDMFEENLELRELNRNVMLVVTDLYEAVYPAEEGEI